MAPAPHAVSIAQGLESVSTAIFTSGTAICGIRGSGKTNCGVVLVEQAVSMGVPVCVVDPTGVWFGIKSSADGKHEGLPVYILGGEHGDAPLDETSGAIVARFVVDERVPVVLDVSDMRKGAQRRFVGEFAEALYHIKNRTREPLFVVIDECARFCPQTLPAKDIAAAKCLGALEDLLALGRSRGIGCCIIGQRPATISKNVLTQADNLIALRTVGTQDRKALDEWVVEAQASTAERDEMVRNLASLGTGEGYFWSPALFGAFARVRFEARRTFDSSRTPRAGETPVEPKAFAKVDLDRLRGEIAAAVERAQADDPRALRARIAELDRELKALRERAVEPEVREVPVLSDDTLVRLESVTKSTAAFVDPLVQSLEEVQVALARVRLPEPRAKRAEHVQAWIDGDVPAVPPAQAGRDHAVAPRQPRGRETREPAVSGDALKAGARRMLKVLCRYGGTLTKAQLATLADVNRNSGTFSEYLSGLRRAGYTVDSAREVTVQPEGARAISATIRSAPFTTAEIVRAYEAKLKAGARRMLEILVAAYPEPVYKQDLAQRAGVNRTSGTFSEYLSTLRRLGLVDDTTSQMAKASPTLFLGARHR